MSKPEWNRAAADGHKHAEAFCLMLYRCKECHRSLRIWNSRDGVTPFFMKCRFCEADKMAHDLSNDLYMPGYKPKIGDYVWKSFTKERAVAMYRQRREFMHNQGVDTSHFNDEALERAANDLVARGEPDLVQI